MNSGARPRVVMLPIRIAVPRERGFEVFMYFMLHWEQSLAAFKRTAEQREQRP